MRMQPVNSSAITAVGYDPASQILAITWKSGDTYEYEDVPASEFAALMKAQSIGRYVAEFIKGMYAESRT